MATTGELLVEYSTLTTGTAMEHFLNISTGDGTGDGVCVLEVELEGIDTVVVEEPISMGVLLEEADFDVKVIEKVTTITKE